MQPSSICYERRQLEVPGRSPPPQQGDVLLRILAEEEQDADVLQDAQQAAGLVRAVFELFGKGRRGNRSQDAASRVPFALLAEDPFRQLLGPVGHRRSQHVPQGPLHTEQADGVVDVNNLAGNAVPSRRWPP